MGEYRLRVARTASRAISETLAESVAAAALKFMTGPLLAGPRRVGKPLHAPLAGRWSARRGQYRVVYTIDDERGLVTVLQIAHRADAYH